MFQGEINWSVEGGVFKFLDWQFSKRLRQPVLAGSCPLLQSFDRFAGSSPKTELFKLDAVIVAVELCTYIANLSNQLRVFRLDWQALACLKQRFRHTAGLCRFDIAERFLGGDLRVVVVEVQIDKRLVHF